MCLRLFGKLSPTSQHSVLGHIHSVLTSMPVSGGKSSLYPKFQPHSSLLRLSSCQLPPFSSLTSSRLAQCTQPLNIFEYFYIHNKNKTLQCPRPTPLAFSSSSQAACEEIVSVPSPSTSPPGLSSTILHYLPLTCSLQGKAGWVHGA